MRTVISDGEEFAKKAISVLRWLFSIGFFFLAITKCQILIKHGMQPYEILVDAVGLPGYVSYYGFVAVLVEIGFAVGIWFDKTYKTAICFAGFMTSVGTVISISFVVFKISSHCGCGLLGDNEYGLLVQKLIIIIGLVFLYRNQDKLFDVQDGV